MCDTMKAYAQAIEASARTKIAQAALLLSSIFMLPRRVRAGVKGLILVSVAPLFVPLQPFGLHH